MRHYLLGQGKWVFVDWMGIEPGYGVAWSGEKSDGYCMPEGLRLAVHQPVFDFTPVLQQDRGFAHEAYGLGDATFLEDQGVFRCWYTCLSPAADPRWKLQVRLGYAESDDGVTWRKPVLGLRDYGGSKENNLILGPEGRVFIDPSAPAPERYRMVAPGGRAGVLGAVSADGLRFTQLPKPILPGNNSDTDNTGWFNPRTGAYAIYTRQRDGVMQRRGINRSESADFTAFGPSTPVIESSPLDPPDWDYYYNGFLPWPGAVDAYLMQIAIFRHHQDTVEVHLATSRDELLWHRPQGLTPWAGGLGQLPRVCSLYPCNGVLPTAAGEWSLYFHADRHGHNETALHMSDGRRCIIRGRIREDGFTSLTADGHGQCWTVPFRFDSEEIRINYRAGYSGSLQAEIIETPIVGGTGHSVTIGAAIPGYTLGECDPLSGDAVDQVLSWRGQSNLGHLRGKEVRLRLSLFRAELFALKFKTV